MPAARQREAIVLSEEQVQRLQRITSSSNGSRSAIVRARMLLRYMRGEPIKAIARKEGVSRPTVQLCIDKALSGGIETAIQDLTRPGRPRSVPPEGRAWVMQLACSRPSDHGYPAEIWTLSQLTAHVRKQARQAGHGCLEHASKYIIRRIIKEASHIPHNVAYYFDGEPLEAREGMASVLTVFKEVELFEENRAAFPAARKVSTGPGGNGFSSPPATIVAALAPEPYSLPLSLQDHQRKPLGTVVLMAGIDLTDGRIIALVHPKSTAPRLGEFFRIVDGYYPLNWRIRIIPGTDTAASSRSNMKVLINYPNRFDLDELRSDGLWLNLLEVFFTRMITSFLRSLRVISPAEFLTRMNQYLDEINLFTVVNR